MCGRSITYTQYFLTTRKRGLIIHCNTAIALSNARYSNNDRNHDHKGGDKGVFDVMSFAEVVRCLTLSTMLTTPD